MALVNRPDNVNSLGRVYQQQRSGNVRPPEGESNATANGIEPGAVAGQDQFVLSDRSAEVNRITEALGDVPEVDEENVARLRDEINSGTYTVNTQQTAERILAMGINPTTIV